MSHGHCSESVVAEVQGPRAEMPGRDVWIDAGVHRCRPQATKQNSDSKEQEQAQENASWSAGTDVFGCFCLAVVRVALHVLQMDLGVSPKCAKPPISAHSTTALFPSQRQQTVNLRVQRSALPLHGRGPHGSEEGVQASVNVEEA